MQAQGDSTVCLTKADIARVKQLSQSSSFFWLDLLDPTSAELVEVGNLLGLHPLAIEDSEHFDQRPKLEEYEDFFFAVFFGAAPEGDSDRLVEVHIFFARHFMVTVRRDESAELDLLHRRPQTAALDGPLLLHSVLDHLVDSFLPVLDDIDDDLERIEAKIFRRELARSDAEIHAVRSRLTHLSRIVHRQRDAMIRSTSDAMALSGLDVQAGPYFRDVTDHLMRMCEVIDSYRDRTGSITEIYLAAVANRQNVVMKQFTVIAGIFLPLTFLVGVFGQNFLWMVEHVNGGLAFAIFGIALPIVITIGLLFWFWRRGWLSEQ